MYLLRAIIGSLLAGVAFSAVAQNSGDVICSFAPSQSRAMSELAGATGGAGVATAAIGKALGLTVVPHSSGALILTGSGGYIAGTLGTAIVAPAVVSLAVIAGGSAITIELACASRNHPDSVANVERAAVAFANRMAQAKEDTVARTSSRIERVVTAFKEVKEDVFEYIYRN